MSQAAKQLGVGRWTLWCWLKGTKKPSFAHRANIYRATHGAVTPQDIDQLGPIALSDKRRKVQCPCCGKALSKSDIDDLRRESHGLKQNCKGGGQKKQRKKNGVSPGTHEKNGAEQGQRAL